MSLTPLSSPVIAGALPEARAAVALDESVGRASRARAYAVAHETVSHRRRRQFFTYAGELIGTSVALLAIPVAILLVGIPIVLLVRLAMWVANSLIALIG